MNPVPQILRYAFAQVGWFAALVVLGLIALTVAYAAVMQIAAWVS